MNGNVMSKPQNLSDFFILFYFNLRTEVNSTTKYQFNVKLIRLFPMGVTTERRVPT